MKMAQLKMIKNKMLLVITSIGLSVICVGSKQFSR